MRLPPAVKVSARWPVAVAPHGKAGRLYLACLGRSDHVMGANAAGPGLGFTWVAANKVWYVLIVSYK